ncbi:MAG: hemolysin family protein [Lachnospiraceae bacterium]|nr:hemolysin family protein [Lachnospiraceae bacterium]
MASDDATGLLLLILLILLLLSAFFSSAETALTTANRIRLQALAEEGDKRAVLAIKTVENRSRLLSTLLIGNNLVNNFLSALAASLAIKLAGDGSISVSTAIITILILIFGEVTPKTIAATYPEKLALAYCPVISVLMKILRPVIFIINSICKLLLKPFHISLDGSMNTVTEQELRTFVDVSHQEGVIEKEEREMIYNVVDFGDSLVKDVMVPRSEVVMISDEDSYDEIKETFRQEKYSRLPVYHEDPAHVVGILNIKKFFCYDSQEGFDIEEAMYKPHFTYEFKKTSDLLESMREDSASLSVVLDEYGDTVGIVSLEDLLEEIVGDIRDEYDADEANLIRQISNREYQIEGSVRLDDINDALGLALESEACDSIGGLVIELLDDLPEEQDAVAMEDGTQIRVLKMEENKIELVQLLLPETPDDSDAAEEEPSRSDKS